DRGYLEMLVERVHNVARGAALETGATLEILPYYPFPTAGGTHRMYENVRPSAALAILARRAADLAGLQVDELPPMPRGGGGASTDFGNVSQVVPSAAVVFAISTAPVAPHSPQVAQAAVTDLAHDNALGV